MCTQCAPYDCWMNELCSVVLSTEWQPDKDISCGPPATDPTSPVIRVLHAVFCRQLTVQHSSRRSFPLSRVLGAKCRWTDEGEEGTLGISEWLSEKGRRILGPLGTVGFRVESNGWKVKRQHQSHKSHRVTPYLHLNVHCQRKRASYRES